MAGIHEEARIPVYINDEQAQSAIRNLTAEAERWKRKMYEAMTTGDLRGMKDAQRELGKINKSIGDIKREAFNVDKILANIGNASAKDIKKAISTLVSEQDKLNRKSVEYANNQKKIRQLRTELTSINGELKTQQSLLSRTTANSFNKYFGIVTATLASFTGVALTVKQAINAYSEYDDKLADVMKTTGLTKDRVTALSDELKKIDTRTSQLELLDLARVAGKLGISAETDILGFVRAADKIRVALSEDLGGDVEESINQIGKLVDIFKLQPEFGIEQSILKVGSAINSLGAAGTANEAYLVEFSKRVAGIAPSAGISIENVLGLAATLDEAGQTAEVSGTVFNQVISGMFKDTATYAAIAGMSVKDFSDLMNTDANEAFVRVLEGANKSGKGFGELTKNLDKLGLDGARATAVLGVLADNTDKLREKQKFSNAEFAKGTSLLDEYNIKNNTAQAQLEKARKAFADMSRELGKQLTPAYTAVINKSKLMVESLMTIISFLQKHGKQLLLVSIAIAGYVAGLKLAAYWTKIETGLTVAYTTVKKLLTREITLATVAQKAWNVAAKANPVGIIIGLLTAAAGALVLYRNKAKEATAEQRALNNEMSRTADLNAQTKSLEDKVAIIKKLSKEQIERLSTDIQSQISLEEDLNAEHISLAKKRFDNDEYLQKMLAADTSKLDAEGLRIYKANIYEQKRWLLVDIADESSANRQRLNNLKQYLTQVNNELKKRPGDKPTYTPDALDDKELKKRIEQLKASNAAEMAEIKQRHLEGKTSEDQYNDELLKQEILFLGKKLGIFKVGSLEYAEAYNELLEKKIGVEENINKRILTAQKQFSRIKTDRAVSEIDISLALEEERWTEEKAALESQLIMKTELSEKEIQLNDLIHKIVEAKEKEHQEKIREIKKSPLKNTVEEIESSMEWMGKIESETTFTNNDQLEIVMAERKAIIERQHEVELEMAGENLKQRLAADKKYEDAKQQMELDLFNAEEAMSKARIDMIQSYIGVLRSTVGEETALGKALYLISQGIAIAGVWIKVAADNAKIYSTALAEFAWMGPLAPAAAAAWAAPIIAANKANALLSTGLILAGTVGSVTQWAKGSNGQYAEGGFTGGTDKNRPAGIVHENEWVAPEELVTSPATRPIINLLESVRQNPSRINTNVLRATAKTGYTSGGLASAGSFQQQKAGTSSGQELRLAADPELKELLRRNTEAIDRFMGWEPRVAVETYEKELVKYKDINKRRGM
jgi:TP901 family phage tail tape measure protein